MSYLSDRIAPLYFMGSVPTLSSKTVGTYNVYSALRVSYASLYVLCIQRDYLQYSRDKRLHCG